MKLALIHLTYIRMGLGRVLANSLVFWFILVVMGGILSGCKKSDPDIAAIMEKIDKPDAMDKLAWDIEHPHSLHPELQKRAQEALLQLKNGVLDPQPMIIAALLMSEAGEIDLFIRSFDEGRDVRGIRIREESVDSNGVKKTFEEEYPAYVDQLKSPTVEDRLLPVTLRDKGQRKDEWQWLKYANRQLDGLLSEFALKLDPKVHPLPDIERPPLYISLPDPNHVRVEVSIYNRAGQGSEWVEVVAGASILEHAKK